MGDHPVVNLAIRGTNLAVMVGHESLQEIMERNPSSWLGHLSVWNWKTGEMKCEEENIPDKDMGLMFLKEDILLHGSSMGPSLNIYHIPTSTRDSGLRLIESWAYQDSDEFYDEFPFLISIFLSAIIQQRFPHSRSPSIRRCQDCSPRIIVQF
jgi:hypothetical protein